MFVISVSPQDTFQNSTVENDILIDQGMMMRMQLVELSQQKNNYYFIKKTIF